MAFTVALVIITYNSGIEALYSCVIFMMNNDVLRKVRYILDLSDKKMIEIFGLAGLKVTRLQVIQWLKKEDDSDFRKCIDENFAVFLNGLIVQKRGKKEGEQPVPEKKLTNNIIFRKLNIAFSFKAEDVLEVLKLADLNLGKHELSAFFRKPNHKNYRACKDQVLRNFLIGLQIKLRGE